MAPPKSGGKRGTINGASVHNIAKFTIRASPLPKSIWEFLETNHTVIRQLHRESRSKKDPSQREVTFEEDQDDMDLQGEVYRQPTVDGAQFWPALEEVCKKCGGEWVDVVNKIVAFGPKKVGTCLLLDARKDSQQQNSYVLFPLLTPYTAPLTEYFTQTKIETG